MTAAKIKEQAIAAVRRMHRTIDLPVTASNGDLLFYRFQVKHMTTQMLKRAVRCPETIGVAEFSKVDLQAVWRELLSRPPEDLPKKEPEWWTPAGTRRGSFNGFDA